MSAAVTYAQGPTDTGWIERRILPLPGWCSVEKAQRLIALVADARARQVVELGVFGGRSLLALAAGCHLNGFGMVEGIDPFEKGASLEGANDRANDEWWAAVDYEQIFAIAVNGVERAGLGPYARIVRQRSQDCASRYDLLSIDVMHQDSNHSEAVSCEEVRLYAPRIALGGFWVIDDTNWPTTKAAQALLERLPFVLCEDHETWRIYQRVGARPIGADVAADA
jgi:cephalosporin hydroxylase